MSVWPTWKENSLFTVLLAILFIYAILFLGAHIKQVGQATPTEHQISVEGTGKVTGKPDIATISFGVESKGADVATAQAANTTAMNTLLGQVKAQEIAEDDIQTANYNAYEEKTWDATTQQERSIGWIVSQQVSVRVRDTAKIGSLLAVLGQNGATNISGPTFTIDDPSNLEAEARAEAIEDARAQAHAIAKSLGVRLGKVTGYAEWSDTAPPMPYDSMMRSALSSYALPTVETGSSDVSLHVTVTYSIDR